MKTYSYRYVGEYEVELPGYGIIRPGELLLSQEEINHPMFVLTEEPKKDKKAK